MTKPKIIFSILIALIVLSFGWYYGKQYADSGRYDAFAQCIADSGTKFYGAFWCPNCQNQKKMFGTSEKLLPYIECSTPNGQGQLQICVDAGITGYPTWEFPDQSRLKGEVPLVTLSERTGCPLPE